MRARKKDFFSDVTKKKSLKNREKVEEKKLV